MNQTPVPLPLVPSLLACLGVVLLLGGGLAPFLVRGEPIRPMELASEMPSEPLVEVSPITFHDGARSIDALEKLIGRSPIAEDRSAFAIDTAPQLTDQPPNYQPQFIGIVGRGDERLALVLWTTEELPIETKVGDQTPWGRVDGVSSKKLTFVKDGTERSLYLFRNEIK